MSPGRTAVRGIAVAQVQFGHGRDVLIGTGRGLGMSAAEDRHVDAG
jgi:hypothetical protein